MDLNEMTIRANAGESEALLQLVNYYTERQEWTEAIDWADKLANTGDVNGMYKAANLHSLRMTSLLNGGIPFWGVMKEDAQAIQKHAGVLLTACQHGKIDLNGDTYSYLLKLFRDALYCEASTCYYSDSSNYERAIQLLKDVEYTREQALCGICYFELSQHDEATRILSKVYQDSSYVSEKKVPVEQATFSTAMFALSVMIRMNTGNLDKAVSILNAGIEGTTDSDMKAPLLKELGRYQKKMLGGWKYT